jgi:hypothetical protein
MFLGHVRSSRNITTYVPRPGQEAEEHKVGPWNIRWVLIFLGQVRKLRNKRWVRSSVPRCLLPMHRPPRLPAPHAPATPALPRSCPAGHTPPYPDPTPPCLGRAPVVRPSPTLPSRAPPDRASAVGPAPHMFLGKFTYVPRFWVEKHKFRYVPLLTEEHKLLYSSVPCDRGIYVPRPRYPCSLMFIKIVMFLSHQHMFLGFLSMNICLFPVVNHGVKQVFTPVV